MTSTTSAAMQIISNLSDAVKSGVHSAQEHLQGAISNVMDATPISRADVALMEETERKRRVESVQEQAIALRNAESISTLLKNGKPHQLSSGFSGFKKYTRLIELREQSRRLGSHDETLRRKRNARNMSRLVSTIGWPFIRNASGPVFVEPNQTELLELVEQHRRVNDVQYKVFGRAHGQKLSGLVLGAAPLKGSKGFTRYTRSLEEKERSRRIRERSESSVSHAWEEAHLIARIGWPLFTQSSSLQYQKDAWSSFDKLEDSEQSRRLTDKSGSKLQQSNAARVARLFGVYELSRGVSYLEEKERSSRLEDKESLQLARQHASEVAALITENKARDIASLEDTERERRLSDMQGMELAQQNGQAVSSLIRRAYVSFLEEQERERRVSRGSSSMATARQVSTLILQHFMNKSIDSSLVRSQEFVAPATSFAPTHQATTLPPQAVAQPLPATSFVPTQQATTFVPTTQAPAFVPAQTNTFVSAPVTFLNSKELKSLTKSAAKHDKLAAKEMRKAEKMLQKANKYNAKGKANKAASLQQNALKHEQAAKQHETVATIEHSKLAPVAPTAVGSPMQ